jgi:hypothetical protein
MTVAYGRRGLALLDCFRVPTRHRRRAVTKRGLHARFGHAVVYRPLAKGVTQMVHADIYLRCLTCGLPESP